LLALTFKPGIENDGIRYFSYLHSLVVDHYLDFTDEYAAVRSEGVAYYPLLIESRTSTGRLADYFPVGTALISLPASWRPWWPSRAASLSSARLSA